MLVCCFVGSEAMMLHGIKYALEKTLCVETVATDELSEYRTYMWEHGFRLIWAVPNGSIHHQLWTAMTKES